MTQGPYRYVRHPMYTAFFGAAVAFALLSANGVIALTSLGSVTLMYLARVGDEERMMLEAFGEPYRDHTLHTGRLLPRLGRRP